MAFNAASPAIIVICTRSGIIAQVARDDFMLAGSDASGQSFAGLCDGASVDNAANFIAELAERGLAFDWELNVKIADTVTALHFVGAAAGDGCIIAGATTSFDAAAHCIAGLGSADERAAAAREAFVRIMHLARGTDAARVRERYDELSGLNNELVNMQRELAKKNAELQRLDREKNQLLGVVAHDLRNPLGVILTYNQLLEVELAELLNEEQREILAGVIRSVEFMQRLIDELLEFAKFELGRPDLRRQETDLVELVRRSTVLNRVLAARKHIEIRCSLGENLPPVTADPAKIEQVLNNLVGNAIKFSHPCTAVEVTVAREERNVLVSVADQGPGIPPEDFGRIFEPFQRAGVASTGGEASTGLGLAIAKKIVTAHGGSIRVESQIGKGSVFHVSLPLPDPARARRTPV